MIAVSLSVYMVGLLVLYTWGQLNNGWYEYYYLWDKGKDVLLLLALYSVAGRFKWAVMPVIIFSIVRFVWQIISSITGWNINNVQAVGWLFIILAFPCSFLLLKELFKWHKSNGR